MRCATRWATRTRNSALRATRATIPPSWYSWKWRRIVKAELKHKASASDAPQVAKHTKNSRVWAEVVSWLWVILAFILIEGGVAQARVIPSGSMENTVLIGEHLLVSRLGYDAGIPFTDFHVPLWRNPKREQIIVFRAPLADQGFP